MKYHVHLYAVVRVKTREIEADSQMDAIEIAERETKMDDAIGLPHYLHGGNVEYAEYGDEIVRAVVDEVGDEEYRRTNIYEPNFDPADDSAWILRGHSTCPDCHGKYQSEGTCGTCAGTGWIK